MATRSMLAIAAVIGLAAIHEARADAFERCVKDAESYLAKKQYDEYGAAMEKCTAIAAKDLERTTGMKVLESARSLNEALKRPGSIGDLTINLYTEKLEALPDDFNKLTNLEKLTIRGVNGSDYWGVHRFDLAAAMVKIARLPNLGTLDLEGELKAADLKPLAKLKTLKALRLTAIDQIPDDVGALSNLEELVVEGKAITSLPAAIGGLGKLTTLVITRTSIAKLPEEIGKLKHLEILDISHNRITSFPPSIRNLKNLRDLRITGNPVAEQYQYEELL